LSYEHISSVLPEIDEAANLKGLRRISTDSSRVAVWAIPTNEELMIARHTRRLLETTKGEKK